MSNEAVWPISPLALERPDRGVLFVVSGPSGVGKSTLIKKAMARIPALEFSVSATTRAPRAGEVDGREYHFVAAERFAALVAEDALLEHAAVYDKRYGTPRAPVEAAMAEGRSILLDIDVAGARQVKLRRPDAVWIYILPPSIPSLQQRIRARGDTAEDVIVRRMAQVGQQLEGARESDYVVVNDDLTTADAVFVGVFLAELVRRDRRQTATERILAS